MEATEKKVLHSPAPWGINRDRNEYEPYRIIIHSVNDRVALCYKDGGPTYVSEQEAEANAKLIAAAPELLKALQGLIDYFQWNINDPSFREYIQAIEAIKKATE